MVKIVSKELTRPVVERTFNLYLEENSYQRIAIILNKEHMQTILNTKNRFAEIDNKSEGNDIEIFCKI